MDFYEDWMKLEEYWFNSNKNIDRYLRDKYGYLLDLPENSNPIHTRVVISQ